MLDQLLSGYPVVVEFPVAWGEMDAFQHVNNVAYIRYFENSRIAFSLKTGMHEYRERTGIGPILKSVTCRYKFPLTYPDTVSVGSRIAGIEDDRLIMLHVVVSHRHQKIAAEGEDIIVMYDYREGKKTAIPDSIRQHLLSLQEKS
jgi:acyl-CoA thioester hydrolase